MSSHRSGSWPLRAACAALLLSPSAFAQTALEEVIVTAQRREENLQETPISIAAFGADEIERRQINNIADLAAIVPNLRIVPFGVSPTTLRIYIRGVGVVDSQVTQDPPVGIYLNGVYVARPVGLTLDQAGIERVEVLRGPQGTLYGRNTTGGAINIITKKPGDKLEFSQLVGVGDYNALRSQTTLSGPLGDKFSAGVSYSLSKRDGWLENTGEGEDFSEYDRDAWRVDLQFRPTDWLTADYSYDGSQSDYTADYYHLTEAAVPPAIVVGLPAQPHRLDETSLLAPFEGSKDEGTGHTLTISADTAVGEFKSITGYREVEATAYNDFSANQFATIYQNNPFYMRQHQFSQELQWFGKNQSETLDWVAGLYYFDESGREIATDTAFVVFPNPRDIAAENKSYAAYLQGTYRPSKDSPWSFTLGGRYTKDERDASNHILEPASREDTNFSPTGMVEYQFDDATIVYGKIVSGYKAGGFNMRQADFDSSFGPEKLTAYELGWKSELLDRRLRFNGAIFYSDYRDIQLDILVPNQPNPTLTQTTNAGKASVYGVEAELDWLIADPLRLSLTYGYLENDIKEVKGDDADLWHLPNAPKNSATATLDWKVAELGIGALNFTVDTSYREESSTGARERPGDGVPSYTLTDFRLSLEGEDWIGQDTTMRITAWVRNAFDEEYYSDTFGSFAGLHAQKVSTYGAPRTYGVDVSFKY
jgi:iron complex outermembrane receptor protein